MHERGVLKITPTLSRFLITSKDSNVSETNLHLHAERDAEDAILFHLKVHTYGSLVVSLKDISTVPAIIDVLYIYIYINYTVKGL